MKYQEMGYRFGLLPSLMFIILVFFSAGGVEIFFGHILSIDGIFKKQELILYLFFSFIAYMYLFAQIGRVYLDVLLQLVLLSLLFLLLVIRDMLFFSGIEIVVLLEMYSIIIIMHVMLEYQRRFEFDAFGLIFRVISALSFVLIVNIFMAHNGNVLQLISLSNIKMLSYLGFVNSFAYACAFGVICAGVSILQRNKNQKTKKAEYIGYVLYLIPLLLYLLMAKSKGGIAVAVLGVMVLFFRAKILASAALATTIISAFFFKAKIASVFIGFMLFGRSVDEGKELDKVGSMIYGRYGASEFFQNPAMFLYNNPFGVGLHNALSTTYTFQEKSVSQGNHSFLMILVESYGVLALIFAFLLLKYVSIQQGKKIMLGIIMIGIPVMVRNEASLALVIPLLLISSTIKLHQRYPYVVGSKL